MTAEPEETGAADVDEWADPVQIDAVSAAGDAEEEPELYFSDVEVFVREHLALLYRRNLDGRHRTWCPEWWRHAEAITRLEALWRAWEHLRLEPALGMSVWLRDHADPHMGVLLDPDGPFKGCGVEKGHQTRLDPLPCSQRPTEFTW